MKQIEKTREMMAGNMAITHNDRPTARTRIWRTPHSRIIQRAVRLAAYTSIFVVMILLNLATAMAFVQSHNLSEIRVIDKHLDLDPFTIRAAGLNLTGGLTDCTLKTSGGVTYCGGDNVNDGIASCASVYGCTSPSSGFCTAITGHSCGYDTDTNTNAATICSSNYFLNGDGTCDYGFLDSDGVDSVNDAISSCASVYGCTSPSSGFCTAITGHSCGYDNYAPDTNANTLCTGTTTYLDGDGGCDNRGSGTTNYIPKWVGTTQLGNSVMYELSSNIGIGSTNPQSKLSVNGNGYSNTAIYGKQPSYTNTWGAIGYYDGADYYGVYGRATDFNFDWYGVYGLGNEAGVYGKTTSSFGDAVVADCATSGCRGLVAWTTSSTGLAGYFSTGRVAINNGGVASACASGLCVGGNGVANTAIYGEAGSSGVYGVYGKLGRASYDGYGVYGSAETTAGYGIGVQGDGGWYGVRGYSDFGTPAFQRMGGYFFASGSTADDIGVHGGGETGVRGSGTTCDFDAIGSGTNWCTTSSERWKTNIQDIPDALDKVLLLRGVYFDWIPEFGGGHDLGMIAEEVGEVLPEIVVYEPDGEYAASMDYSMLTPVLVEAIKEQQEQIDELKALVCNDHPEAAACKLKSTAQKAMKVYPKKTRPSPYMTPSQIENEIAELNRRVEGN